MGKSLDEQFEDFKESFRQTYEEMVYAKALDLDVPEEEIDFITEGWEHNAFHTFGLFLDRGSHHPLEFLEKHAREAAEYILEDYKNKEE